MPIDSQKTCAECGTKFDPLWRLDVAADLDDNQLAGALAQILYCSVACKRRAANRRYYRRHRRPIIDKNNDRNKRLRKERRQK